MKKSFSPYIDFNCTSMTSMCFFVKIRNSNLGQTIEFFLFTLLSTMFNSLRFLSDTIHISFNKFNVVCYQIINL